MQKQFTKFGDGLLVRAPGKVNLSLLVKGKRADGFHELETIMAKIAWYDEILIETRDEGRETRDERRNVQYPIANVECPGETNIKLICKGPYKVPEGEDNLVYKAARLILDCRLSIADCSKRKNEGVKLTLVKNMPAGSGLGSGSSDAAATLLGINKFLKLGLGKKELRELAAKLGSDVSFFLDGPIALCTGRGEKVKKLAECEFRVFLVVPDVSTSTKRVYENYRHNERLYKRLHEQISEYISKKRIDFVWQMCANMLSESSFELHPEIESIKQRMESLGIGPVCLSGSGSAMFCIIEENNEQRVRRNGKKLEREYGCKVIIVNNNRW